MVVESSAGQIPAAGQPLRKKITQSVVDNATYTTEGQWCVFDTAIPGFFLRVGTRTKTFTLQRDFRRDGQRRTLRRALGRGDGAGAITVAEARKRAGEYISQLDRGIDPEEEQERQATDAKKERERGMTLRDAWELFQQEGEHTGRAEKTRRRYEQIIDTYFDGRTLRDGRGYERWLDRPLRDITPNDVRLRHHELGALVAAGEFAQTVHRTNDKRRKEAKRAGHRQAPHNRTGHHTANDAFRLFRAIYNSARVGREDELPENPCRALRKAWFKVTKPRTAIPREQLQTWYEGTARVDNPIRRDYLRFVLFTGLRRETAAAIHWRNIDFARRTLHIPKPKGGAERTFTLPLSDYLVDLLQRRRDENAELECQQAIPAGSDEWVFPAWSESGHIEEPREEIAGIAYTIHDLRRTFATVAESLDISPFALKALLNHAQPGNDVTAGYMSITTERLREPMQRIADHLLRIVNGRDGSDNVIALPKAKQ